MVPCGISNLGKVTIKGDMADSATTDRLPNTASKQEPRPVLITAKRFLILLLRWRAQLIPSQIPEMDLAIN